MKTLNDFVASIIENGGATYNLVNGGTVNDGYMVSKKGYEMKFEPESDVKKAVIQFIKEYGFELHDAENFLGAWMEKGILYMDISNNIKDRSEAIRKGYEGGQLAIYDVKNEKTIYLPSPQKTGTMRQQADFINYQIYNL